MRRILSLFAALAVTVSAAAGCSVEPSDDDDDAMNDDDGQDDAIGPEDEEVASLSSELYGCNQCRNCVDYARCRQPRLPHGLTSYADKRSKINSQRARRGCVAVINTGSYYGHVAYVRKVSGSRIFIDEGNWPSGRCGQRSGTKGALRISGFICR